MKSAVDASFGSDEDEVDLSYLADSRSKLILSRISGVFVYQGRTGRFGRCTKEIPKCQSDK